MVIRSVGRVCLSLLFWFWLLKALTYKLHCWYAGTSSEYIGQVCMLRSSVKVKVTGTKRRVGVTRLNRKTTLFNSICVFPEQFVELTRNWSQSLASRLAKYYTASNSRDQKPLSTCLAIVRPTTFGCGRLAKIPKTLSFMATRCRNPFSDR